MIDKIKERMMLRLCPEYLKRMPEDKPGAYVAEAIVSTGYWADNHYVVASKNVAGFLAAYKTARWMALKAQFRYPAWLYDCGIHYGVKEMVEG